MAPAGMFRGAAGGSVDEAVRCIDDERMDINADVDDAIPARS